MRISPNAFDPLKESPSILEQTQWPCGFFTFPYRYKVQYFNPAIVDWMGKRYLVARRRRHATHPGKNDIVLWWIGNDMRPLREHQVLFPTKHPSENWEDPRASVVDNALWLSWAAFRAPWQMHYVHQAAGVVNTRFQVPYVCNVVYGGNGPHSLANTGNEKNWCWFSHEEAMHFVYSPSPHVVVKTSGGEKVEDQYQSGGISWKCGLPRGGTNPILFDGLYWTFFHSSLEISLVAPKRRYYMGAYAFESKPPFRPVMMTRKHLLCGSENDPREPSAPLCVFPCGAMLEGEEWLVTLGVNDCSCAWIRIPHADLLKVMTKCSA